MNMQESDFRRALEIITRNNLHNRWKEIHF